MHQSFIKRLERLHKMSLGSYHIALIKEVLIPQRLRKYEYFLKQGSICQNFGFIVNGALKQFSVDEHGKEMVCDLYIEGDWSVDRASLLKKKPSPYYIQATEHTELLLMNEKGYEQITDDPLFSKMVLRLLEDQNCRLRRQLEVAKSCSAGEKLENLEKDHPEYILRFPQHVIASYLGITKETLSRIRRRGD